MLVDSGHTAILVIKLLEREVLAGEACRLARKAEGCKRSAQFDGCALAGQRPDHEPQFAMLWSCSFVEHDDCLHPDKEFRVSGADSGPARPQRLNGNGAAEVGAICRRRRAGCNRRG
jgi:hypothetical protein